MATVISRSKSLCIICEDACDNGNEKRMPWEGRGLTGGSSSADMHLNSQLSVILLVRKILGVPKNVIESILCKRGDPSTWGLKMCGPCRRIFLEAEFLNSRINQLNEEFLNLTKILRRQVKKDSLIEKVKDDVKVHASFKEPSKRGRKGRKRKRHSGNKEVQNFTTIVESTEQNDDDIRRLLLDSFDVSMSKMNEKKRRDIETIEEKIETTKFPEFSKIGKVEHSSEVLKSTSTEALPDQDQNPLVSEDEGAMDDEHFNDNDVDSDYVPDGEGEGDTGIVTKSSNTNTEKKTNRIDMFAIPQPVKIVDDDQYQCPLCPRKTLIKSSMHGHILRAHYNDSNPFHCHLCEKAFKRETLLRTHLERIHDGAKTPLDEPDEVVNIDETNEHEIEDPSDSSNVANASNPQADPAPEKARTHDCDLCPKMKYRVLYASLETLEAHKKVVHFGIKKPYSCHLCGKTFKLQPVLRQHLFVHKRKDREKKNKIRPFCLQCNREFKNFATLRAHLQDKGHTSRYPFQCEICGQGFMQEQHLEGHKTDEHTKKAEQTKPEEKPVEIEKERYYCEECNREFKNSACLKAHMETTKAHSKQLYHCELCTKSFYQKPSLEKHQTLEHYKELNIVPFKCDFCGKMLSCKRSLDHHLRLRHTKDTEHKCLECDLGFLNEAAHKRHISIVHAKERPYLCTYCPKKFTAKSHLDTHVRVHTGEKPYKCRHCGKQYSDRPTFNRHVETHGEQTHICSFCSKEFKVWHSFRLHMKTAHKQNIFKYPPVRAPEVKPDPEFSDGNSISDSSKDVPKCSAVDETSQVFPMTSSKSETFEVNQEEMQSS